MNYSNGAFVKIGDIVTLQEGRMRYCAVTRDTESDTKRSFFNIDQNFAGIVINKNLGTSSIELLDFGSGRVILAYPGVFDLYGK